MPYAKSEDGFESHFAVNYLGHCLLTHLLLPRMIDTAKEKGSNCRIVNVSSCAHLAGSVNFKDLSMRYVLYWISIWCSCIQSNYLLNNPYTFLSCL